MRLSPRRFVGLALVGLGAVALSVCGGGGNSPSGPAQPTAPPVVTPTAAPAPTPDSVLSLSCAKLPVGALTPSCRADTSDFQADVDEAIRTLQREQPQIFNGDEVLSTGAYYVGLIRVLDRQGLPGRRVGAGDVSDQALAFAAEKRIRLVQGAELVKLLPRVGGGGRAWW